LDFVLIPSTRADGNGFSISISLPPGKALAAVPGAQNLPELFRGHFGLWEVKAQPPPKVKAPSVTIYLDDSESQILSPDSFYLHPDYPMDSYLS
jgi:hypothetical protein